MHYHTIEIDGRPVHVTTAGDGPPLLLLHGGGIDSALLSWSEAIPPLAEHFRIYAPDWPGYGASRPFDSREYTIAMLVDVLGKLLDALGLERVQMAGVSMGGAAALGYALDHPQRIEKLVLVDSYGLQRRVPFHRLAYLLVQAPWLRVWSYAAMRRSRRVTRWGLQTSIFAGKVPEALVEEVYQTLQLPYIEDTFALFQNSEILWSGLHTCYMDRVHELPMPVLLVHGAADRLVPLSAAQEAAQRIPRARLHVFEKTGHWVPRERPEAFNRLVLDFLKSE